ncbi:cysteine desulfurase family protein [Vallicoccus soli]|uniref:Aminotransferase class V-fold PLP-dependent enzyme n=1 Tax=Vallicoccus soli TaxID=2339232 RepID=A0A3A3ZLA2_9ACTN|nr:aminotransferase class V-fold PLP-dependent enzyme [Vallicoccus soli]RJK96902.1 aminotransferase class V-fold PLP-dependent enzyme [Vallicoccus soli]
MAYLDAASAHPLHPAAREVWAAALEQGWADPARLHAEGRRAGLLLEEARAGVAAVLGAHPDEVSFTASGTQACHLAVLGASAARRDPAGAVVATAVEHSAVLQAARAHERSGGALRLVPVDREGRAAAEDVAALAGPGTALVAVQAGNHEVGTTQPVAEVGAACAERGVPLLVDAAQAVGRAPVPAGWSLLTASAHKWGGPPGVGVLVVRRGTRWRSPLPEDEREGGRVPGPPAVPAVLAAAVALQAAAAAQDAESARLSRLVERLRREVPRRVPDVALLGSAEHRLPHLVAFSCLYVDGESVVTALSRAGHAVSSGSSCTASTLRPSHVLEAMGVLTHGNVRVSLPAGTTDADVERFLDDLPGVVAGLRAAAGVQAL